MYKQPQSDKKRAYSSGFEPTQMLRAKTLPFLDVGKSVHSHKLSELQGIELVFAMQAAVDNCCFSHETNHPQKVDYKPVETDAQNNYQLTSSSDFIQLARVMPWGIFFADHSEYKDHIEVLKAKNTSPDEKAKARKAISNANKQSAMQLKLKLKPQLSRHPEKVFTVAIGYPDIVLCNDKGSISGYGDSYPQLARKLSQLGEKKPNNLAASVAPPYDNYVARDILHILNGEMPRYYTQEADIQLMCETAVLLFAIEPARDNASFASSLLCLDLIANNRSYGNPRDEFSKFPERYQGRKPFLWRNVLDTSKLVDKRYPEYQEIIEQKAIADSKWVTEVATGNLPVRFNWQLGSPAVNPYGTATNRMFWPYARTMQKSDQSIFNQDSSGRSLPGIHPVTSSAKDEHQRQAKEYGIFLSNQGIYQDRLKILKEYAQLKDQYYKNEITQDKYLDEVAKLMSRAVDNRILLAEMSLAIHYLEEQHYLRNIKFNGTRKQALEQCYQLFRDRLVDFYVFAEMDSFSFANGFSFAPVRDCRYLIEQFARERSFSSETDQEDLDEAVDVNNESIGKQVLKPAAKVPKPANLTVVEHHYFQIGEEKINCPDLTSDPTTIRKKLIASIDKGRTQALPEPPKASRSIEQVGKKSSESKKVKITKKASSGSCKENQTKKRDDDDEDHDSFYEPPLEKKFKQEVSAVTTASSSKHSSVNTDNKQGEEPPSSSYSTAMNMLGTNNPSKKYVMSWEDEQLFELLKGPNVDVNKVEYLLRQGAKVNAQNREGNSPLHIALAHHIKNVELIALLLYSGADKKLLNLNGAVPMDCLPKDKMAYQLFGEANLLAHNYAQQRPAQVSQEDKMDVEVDHSSQSSAKKN